MLKKQQLRWQSLRSFNIIIVCSFIFFFLIGITQSYTFFTCPATFTTPLFVPLSILLLCIITLYFLTNHKDKMAQQILPITCVFITLFVVINSHSQEQTYSNSFLYLALLLPLFYSYLFSYNTLYLILNNIFLTACYVFASIIGDTDSLVFLFNSTFLIALCYLSIFTQLRNSTTDYMPLEKEEEDKTIFNQKYGRYLNRIIHDIRQPLSSLSLHSHLLEKKLVGAENIKLAKNIKHSSEELERWLSSLLDLARLDSQSITANITEISLALALSPTIKKYQYQASSNGIRLTSRLPNLIIKTDQTLLIEIVDVLLSNALIHGSQIKGAQVFLSVRNHSDRALLQVWSQGQTIEDSTLESLYDEVAQAENPFHNKSKGIGLGLPVAQRKAKLMGSEITALTHSKGNRFSLSLEKAKHPKKTIDLNKLISHSHNHNILLIDDDSSILSALGMLLENWGYKADCVLTAEEGITKFSQKQYDLIISDYRLPNQKTGLDVFKKIKEKNNVPAILLTGEADPEKLKAVQETTNIIHYKILNKPVKPAALRFLLKQLLA